MDTGGTAVFCQPYLEMTAPQVGCLVNMSGEALKAMKNLHFYSPSFCLAWHTAHADTLWWFTCSKSESARRWALCDTRSEYELHLRIRNWNCFPQSLMTQCLRCILLHSFFLPEMWSLVQLRALWGKILQKPVHQSVCFTSEQLPPTHRVQYKT